MDLKNTDEEQVSDNKVKVFKYRWIILTVFCFAAAISFFQLMQFSIISNVLQGYYNVESLAVDSTSLIFFVTFVFGSVPINFAVEKYSLKISCISAVACVLIGNLIKLGGTSPDKFWVLVVAQAVCSFGLVCMANIPTKFASSWFGATEVSTACAIAVFGTQLGAALGSVIPPFVIGNSTKDDTKNEFFNFFLYQAVVSAGIFIITCFFFRSRPKLPPSQSQLVLIENGEESRSFSTDLKALMKNRDYILVVCSLGMANAVFNSFGILLNDIYTNYFGEEGKTDAGLLAMIAIISGGCIGSVVFGLILDKTHQFKKVGFVINSASALCLVIAGCTIIFKSRIGNFIAIPIFGFFLNSTLVVGYEYALEVSYPIPESCSCSILNALNYLLSIIITLVMEGIIALCGYPAAIGLAVIVLSISAVNVLFISDNLRRRDANLASS